MQPYKRGDSQFWWIGFVDVDGEWEYRSTGVTDKRLAQRALEQIEAAIAKGAKPADTSTVLAWAEEWKKHRTGWNAKPEWRQQQRHVLPELGAMKIADVRPKHIRDVVRRLKAKGLAPRTIKNIWWVMSSMFSDAIVEELIETSPCVLKKKDRPAPARDKDRTWRKSAVYSRAEVELLISSELVPIDRRVAWALNFGGLGRLGELSALRWRHYDEGRGPLGCLTVESSYTRVNKVEKATKTEVAREVPVHPTLAAILAEWRLHGWFATFGRHPKPSDLVLPNRAGRHITDNNLYMGRQHDFEALGIRPRTWHDGRRTFISLGQADGARRDVLKAITHNPGEVMDGYTVFPWPTLCEAVACLKLERRSGALRVLPTVRTTSAPEGDSTMHTDSRNSLAQEGIRTLAQPAEPTDDGSLPSERASVKARPPPSAAEERRNVGSSIPNLPARLQRLVAKYSKAGGR